jgi:hypothetical protein
MAGGRLSQASGGAVEFAGGQGAGRLLVRGLEEGVESVAQGLEPELGQGAVEFVPQSAQGVEVAVRGGLMEGCRVLGEFFGQGVKQALHAGGFIGKEDVERGGWGWGR